MSDMTTREQLQRLVAERPDLDQSELAAIIGVSRQRVNQLVHCKLDPIPVEPRNNHRKMVSQQALVRLVETVQRVLREHPEVTTWKEVARLGRITGNVGATLRDREPLFYAVVGHTLSARRITTRRRPSP